MKMCIYCDKKKEKEEFGIKMTRRNKLVHHCICIDCRTARAEEKRIHAINAEKKPTRPKRQYDTTRHTEELLRFDYTDMVKQARHKFSIGQVIVHGKIKYIVHGVYDRYVRVQHPTGYMTTLDYVDLV
jgi:hypothetical protein